MTVAPERAWTEGPALLKARDAAMMKAINGFI
jgi:hypothetical protein